jgi:hypothetical protein
MYLNNGSAGYRLGFREKSWHKYTKILKYRERFQKYPSKDRKNLKLLLKYLIYLRISPLNIHFLENNLSVIVLRSRYIFGL